MRLYDWYAILDTFLSNLPVCKNCKWFNCRGYVWLLKEEAQELLDMGIPVVEINEELNFIHSFPRKEGKLDLEVKKVQCILYQNNVCSIYQQRPFVCRIYPFGLDVIESKIKWVLHRDCEITVSKEKTGKLQKFCSDFLEIVKKLDKQKLKEIKDTYFSVNEISFFPDGRNNTIIL